MTPRRGRTVRACPSCAGYCWGRKFSTGDIHALTELTTRERAERYFGVTEVVRVEIRELPPRRPVKRKA
jgi:hypothetical protein